MGRGTHYAELIVRISDARAHAVLRRILSLGLLLLYGNNKRGVPPVQR